MTPMQMAAREMLRRATPLTAFAQWSQPHPLARWERLAQRVGVLGWLARRGWVKPLVEQRPIPKGGGVIVFRRPKP